MKKLIIILLLAFGFVAQSQTITELTNIINTKGTSITIVSAGSLNADLFSIDLNTSGFRKIGIRVSGTWVGTLSFQGSNDNFTTVDPISGYIPGNIPTWQTGTSSNGQFNIPTVGFRYVRIRMTSYTSGTATAVAYGYLSSVDDGMINGTVAILGSTLVNGTFWQATQPVSGTFWQATQPVSAASLPLPTGASTSALQTTGNTSVANIDTKTPALGQAAMAASQPVVIASNQSGIPVTGTFWQATQPVSGTFWQATQPVSGTVSINAIPAGTNNIGDVDVLTLPAIPVGTNVIGKVGIDQTTPGTTNKVDIGTNGTVVANAGTGTFTVNQLQKRTYRAASAAVLVTAVTVNVPWFVIQGSATQTIRIQKIIITGLTLTAVQYLNMGIAKYSTAASGGTATTFTKIPIDANDAAATANLVQGYTAIPTSGTRIGFIAVRRNLGQATTAAAAGVPENIEFIFDSKDGTVPVLRGTAQGIGLEWLVAPATAVSLLIQVEWTEE